MGKGDGDIFDEALARGQFGLALIDARLIVIRRLGALSDWTPAPGEPACAAPLLVGMEESLAALRESGGEIVLPSMRVAPEAGRVTVSIFWSAPAAGFLVVTTPDHAGEQIDRLMASDRREKQLLRQQADAAAARLRVADALYRDIVESSNHLVLRFGPDGRVVFANRAAGAFFGRPQDALVGAPLTTLFPAAENAPLRLDAAIERPAAFETSARDAKGDSVWLAWDISFLGPEGGGEFQAVARDVTAEWRLRVAREKAQEEARAAAVAHERLRIAQDLHDTLVRSIVTMITQARLVAKTTTDAQTKAALAELDQQARQGLWEAREAIAQTRAARREDADLRAIAEAFAAGPAAPAVALEIPAEPALGPETAQLCAAVLREALRNIELHAGAKNVRIELRSEAEGTRLLVEDDGAGFDPQAPAPGHFGVAGMRERAKLARAALIIESAPGPGTRLSLFAPRESNC